MFLQEKNLMWNVWRAQVQSEMDKWDLHRHGKHVDPTAYDVRFILDLSPVQDYERQAVIDEVRSAINKWQYGDMP